MDPSRITLIAGLLLFPAVQALASGGEIDMAPPTLDYYLRRAPAKSISQVLDGNPGLPSSKKPSVIYASTLIGDFSKGSSPQLVDEMDRLLVQARQNAVPPAEFNLLQDFRDLASSEATPAEMHDYVQWRLNHLQWFVAEHIAPYDKAQAFPDRIAEVDGMIAASSKAMLPFWIYLKGALYYKEGNDTDSEACFDRVLKEFPASPRAETALFMKGRCRLSQSVETYDEGDSKKDHDAIRSQAEQLFRDYLARHPQGRYRNDVTGWLGGAYYRSGDYAAALTCYIQQIENKDHPEDLSPAIIMIEKCLYHLSDSHISDIDEIAKHPEVAMALAYFAVNASAADTNDTADEIAGILKWRQAVLPKLATAVLGNKDIYQDTLNRNRYLAILAHAASDQGRQDEALAILKMGSGLEQNDDFAFVQALVLQRAGRQKEALDAYRDFLRKFPSSPLAPGARFREALVLHDEKKDGEALLQLAAMRSNRLPMHAAAGGDYLIEPDDNPLPQPASAINIDYSGASAAAIDQAIDAILNFAPLDSLETALQGSDSEHSELREDLKRILKERFLAKEDFAGAAKFAASPGESEAFLKLASQADAAKRAHGAARARESFQIADYWSRNAKMQLVLPLDSEEMRRCLFGDDLLGAGLRRRTNSLALSFDNADRELQGRNQWQHAIDWWLHTDSGKSAYGPKALWNVLQARRKIVEISPYTQQKAVETGAQETVRKEYNRLVRRYPDSVEAEKYAAYWNFPTAAELAKANSDYTFTRLAYTRSKWNDEYPAWGPEAGIGVTPDYFYPDNKWDTVCNGVSGFFKEAPQMDAPTFEEKVAALLDAANPLATAMNRMALINCLVDLKEIARVQALDPDIRNRYVALRHAVLLNTVRADIGSIRKEEPGDSDDRIRESIAALQKDPRAQPVEDFLHFLDLAVTASHLIDVTVPGLRKDDEEVSYSSRDYPALASGAEAFLSQYPVSPKREAAYVLRLRGLDLAAFPHRIRNTVPWPEANSWAGDPSPAFHQQTQFDAVAFEKGLKDYYAGFPEGRYSNTVLSYRADTALMDGRWGAAMDDLLSLMQQKNAREFGSQIVREFTTIFNKLDNDALRAQVLGEIFSRPAARQLLQLYLNEGGIPYLKDYLQERLKKAQG